MHDVQKRHEYIPRSVVMIDNSEIMINLSNILHLLSHCHQQDTKVHLVVNFD